ncbi:DUF2889 domain-containing protein [Malikia spinosa]|uniref:DUF2889 domain-containing protein n=1 Tax=Malikia spinosa TaxID=86180 RepID=UPI0027BB15E1|nr:DUF2889 domain-containing protein [Malikia spinosa]
MIEHAGLLSMVEPLYLENNIDNICFMSQSSHAQAAVLSPARTPLHHRRIELQGYRRPDGLWDIEGELLDVKQYDYTSADGAARRAGEPLHLMKVRLTVNASMTLTDIEASMVATPFPECQGGGATLGDLIGTSLASGWRQTIDRVAGRTAGCTHIRELLAAMATAAFQTVAHDLTVQRQERGEPLYPSDTPPPMFGQCKAWDFDGPVVQRIAPQFAGYRATVRKPSENA